MKTMTKFTGLFFFFLTAFNLNSVCQIKVSSNNYVGINYSSTPSSRFVINHVGNSAYQAYIFNPSNSFSSGALMTVSDKGIGTLTSKVAHYSQALIGVSNYFYGIKSIAYSSTPTTDGRAYGILGMAGNASTGYNYAVYGSLSGTNYGAAIFGAVNGLGDVGLSAQFAGYFRGNVKTENDIYCLALHESSDEKFKTNIIELDPAEAISNILLIRPVKYNLKQVEITQTAGDTTSISKFFNESDLSFSRTKYGVIAQELQKIYPELVSEEGDGNLAVRYTGLIPIMIEVIQSQQKRIEDFEEKIISLAKELSELKAK